MTTSQLASQIEEIKAMLQDQSPRPLSLPEAAEYLNVSRSYVYRLTSGALIPHYKTQGGKKITFLKSDLDKWLTAHRVKTREEIAEEIAGCTDIGNQIEFERSILATAFLKPDNVAFLLPPDFQREQFKTPDYKLALDALLEDFEQHGRVDWQRIGKNKPKLVPLLTDIISAPQFNEFPEAVDLLQSGAITNHVVDAQRFRPVSSGEVRKILSLTIKSDDENKLIAFLGMLSAYTEDSQVNVMFNAPSSTGKSYIPTEVAKLFPQEDVLQYGGASPTSFFHSGKFDKDQDSYTVDLERKVLIFLDQPHQQLLERLRSLLSHDSKIITHKITDKTQRGGTKTKTIYLKGFCSVVFCTASLKTDEQEATRCFLLSPESSQAKLQAGIIQKLRKESDPETFNRILEADQERQLLKQRIRGIKQERITDILINKPEEEMIAAIFLRPKMLKPRHQRDIGRIISLVKTFALLNLWWRDRNGSTITANASDVDEAFAVWERIADSQELNLAPYVYALYQEIILPAFNEKNQGEFAKEHKTGVSRKEILQQHSRIYGRPLAIDKLRFEILPQLEASGLIVQETDSQDRRNKLIYPTQLQ